MGLPRQEERPHIVGQQGVGGTAASPPDAAQARSAPSARSWSISTKPEDTKCRRGTRSSSRPASTPSRQEVRPENRSNRASGRCGRGAPGPTGDRGLGKAGAGASVQRTAPPGKGPPAPGACVTTSAPMVTHVRMAPSTSAAERASSRDEGGRAASPGRRGESPVVGSAWARQKDARRSVQETTSD